MTPTAFTAAVDAQRRRADATHPRRVCVVREREPELEPTTHDPFIDDLCATPRGEPPARARRRSRGSGSVR